VDAEAAIADEPIAAGQIADAENQATIVEHVANGLLVEADEASNLANGRPRHDLVDHIGRAPGSHAPFAIHAWQVLQESLLTTGASEALDIHSDGCLPTAEWRIAIVGRQNTVPARSSLRVAPWT